MLQKYIFSIPVDCDTMFSNHKNTYKKSIEKRQRTLITKISFIEPFLKKDENVLLLTKGYSTKSLLENLVMGWLLLLFKRSIFVFTNKRIFHIPCRFDYSYRYSLAQIVYSRCKSIALKFGTLSVDCPTCDSKDRYTGICRKDKKRIKVLLQTLKFGLDKSGKRQKEHLCPRCGTPLVLSENSCRKCRLEFKTRGKATLWSFLVPAGGYFYTRNTFLGVINAGWKRRPLRARVSESMG